MYKKVLMYGYIAIMFYLPCDQFSYSLCMKLQLDMVNQLGQRFKCKQTFPRYMRFSTLIYTVVVHNHRDKVVFLGHKIYKHKL